MEMDHAFDVDVASLRPFFDAVPELFGRWHATRAVSYDVLLYAVAGPHTPADLALIDRLLGLEHQGWAAAPAQRIIRLFDEMRYPDVTPLARLEADADITLEQASRYAHFFHHVYPPYERASVVGSGLLGLAVDWTEELEPDVYRRYTEAIEWLKEKAPWWALPESHVPRQRVMQAALAEWAHDQGALH